MSPKKIHPGTSRLKPVPSVSCNPKFSFEPLEEVPIPNSSWMGYNSLLDAGFPPGKVFPSLGAAPDNLVPRSLFPTHGRLCNPLVASPQRDRPRLDLCVPPAMREVVPSWPLAPPAPPLMSLFPQAGQASSSACCPSSSSPTWASTGYTALSTTNCSIRYKTGWQALGKSPRPVLGPWPSRSSQARRAPGRMAGSAWPNEALPHLGSRCNGS